MYIQVTIKDKDGQYTHNEYFPKFDKIKSINHLQEVYKDNLVGWKLLGTSNRGIK